MPYVGAQERATTGTPVQIAEEEEEGEEEWRISYPLKDRFRNSWEHREWNSFMRLPSDSLIKKKEWYHPRKRYVTIQERIAGQSYRHPSLYSEKDFLRIQSKKNQESYFKKRSELLFFMNKQGAAPRLKASGTAFNNLFGLVSEAGSALARVGDLAQKSKTLKDLPAQLRNKKIRDSLLKEWMKKNFRLDPQGFMDFTLGAESFENNIPTIPENLRKTVAPILDMQYDLNLNAQVGSKLQIPLHLSNQNNFSLGNINAANQWSRIGNNLGPSALGAFTNPFQQSMYDLRVNYDGTEDQIIKQMELGATSFESGGILTPSVHHLFGVSTRLQFGRLHLSSSYGLQLSSLKTITLSNGGAQNNIRLKASQYDAFKNFLLGHYFRKNFNQTMSRLPLVQSRVQILRVEVWITNRNHSVNNSREILGFADLGECGADARHPSYQGCLISGEQPANERNRLYQDLNARPGIRSGITAQQVLTTLNLDQGRDYERFYAYKLPENAYYFNPFAGFLMIYENISPEFAVSVAYEYLLDGKHYQVGEFSNQLGVSADTSANPKLLITKLLKPIIVEPLAPVWRLMMKNVYAVGLGGFTREGFELNVRYQEPSRGEKVYLPFADPNHQKNMLELIQSDRLNFNNDAQSDGWFDFIEGYTVVSERGKIIFPVLEPFGRDLEPFVSDPEKRRQFLYYSLYDSIPIVASLQVVQDRYYITGHVQLSDEELIFLGSNNIVKGSVRVFQGVTPLQEYVDYLIDYGQGTLTILNKSLLQSRLPLTVQMEDNSTASFQRKFFLGLKMDYQWTPDFKVGATFTRYAENPFNLKTPVGLDPVANIIYGVNASYKTRFPALSYALDKLLPFYVTEKMSFVTLKGEWASLLPGTSALVGRGNRATLYLDDFESDNANIPLDIAPTNYWNFASVPTGAQDGSGNILFPNAGAVNELRSGFGRAKLAWYQIEPNLQTQSSNNPAVQTDLTDHRWRQISTFELFPSASVDVGRGFIRTFDMAFFPNKRGPYNFDAAAIDAAGFLKEPEEQWAGIMGSFKDQSNFEARNVQFLEFWLQDPFVYGSNPEGGTLYFDLGNVSEDILKDRHRMYENGLPALNNNAPTLTTVWGKVPASLAVVSNAFSNNPAERSAQDIGLDGLSDEEERAHFSAFVQGLQGNLTASAFAAVLNDPAADNFVNYRDPRFTAASTILDRYENYNGPQGNATPTDGAFFSGKLEPDGEDINGDNLMNESEDYFQYRVALTPQMNIGDAGGFIVDRRTINTNNAAQPNINWYLFRIPLQSYFHKVGQIRDFKSIRFIRMYLTGFKEPTVFRMTRFSLIAPSWRQAQFALTDDGTTRPLDNRNTTYFLVAPIGLEENDRRLPVPYVLPPGIERIQQTTISNANVFLNEQALSLKTRRLQPQDSRAVFKIFDKNLVQYRRMELFIHAEGHTEGGMLLQTGDVSAILRIGNDMTNNYYEVIIPLQPTQGVGVHTREAVWPAANNLDLDLTLLARLKTQRDAAGASAQTFYEHRQNGRIYRVMGHPSLGQTNTILVALKNTHTEKAPVDAEMWINELRLSDLNQETAYAGYAHSDFQLADLGTLLLSGSFRTPGWGGIEENVLQRTRDWYHNIGVVAHLELGKITPDFLNITIPFYMNYSYSKSAPQYDPLDLDVLTKDKLDVFKTEEEKMRYRQLISEQSSSHLYSINKMHLIQDSARPLRFWSPSLWQFSMSYTLVKKQSPLVKAYEYENIYANLGYAYSPEAKYWHPFKRLVRQKRWHFIRQLNINPHLSQVQFQTTVQRYITAQEPRNVQDAQRPISTYFSKFFYMERLYGFKWLLMRSVALSYQAKNYSVIDEPDGFLSTATKQNEALRQVFRGGRTVEFTQQIGVVYDVPTDLVPLFNWTKLRMNYNVNYKWVSAKNPLFALGNTLYNEAQTGVSLELNFARLFGKYELFRQKDRLNWQSIFVTWLDNIRFSYNENRSTTLPGILARSQFLGNDWRTHTPGAAFILGKQPTPQLLDRLAQSHLISRDPNFNSLFLQTFDQTLRISATFKPLVYFNVQLNWNYSLGKNYRELFKDIDGSGQYRHLNNYSSGRFQSSYWAFQTLFDQYDQRTQLTKAYRQFLDNRSYFSQKIGQKNPNSIAGAGGFYKGYDAIAQDVLIPSFISAYGGKDKAQMPAINYDQRVSANPFSGFLPMPDWRVTFNGLSQIPGLKKILPQVLLTNAYSGLFSINAIASNPTYEEFESLRGVPVFVDTLSGNFVPYYRIPNVSISDRFDPLLGVDIGTRFNFSFGFRYGKERTTSLSLVDFQVSENYRETFGFNASHRFKGARKWSERFRKKIINMFTIRLDANIIQDYNYNIRIDQNTKQNTGGNRIITLLPSVEYWLNQMFLFKVFYEYRSNQTNLNLLRNINQRGGILLRVTFGN